MTQRIENRRGVRLGRRTFIRGAAGTALALPLLEVMQPAAAKAAVGEVPKKYVVCSGGGALGIDRDYFVPDATGRGYDLKTSLEPLGPGTRANGFFDVRDDVTVVSGMELPFADVNGDQSIPGVRGSSIHVNIQGALFCGNNTSSKKIVTNKKGEQLQAGVRPYGPSSDAVVGQSNGAKTVFPWLSLSMRRYSANSFRHTMSFAADDTGAIVGIAPYVQPYLAFDSILAGLQGSAGAASAEALARRDLLFRKRRSVLDLVGDGLRRLTGKVSTSDRQTLEQHFTVLRELEARVQRIYDLSLEEGGAACSTIERPAEKDWRNIEYGGYAGEQERGRLLSDILTVAFACDLTRSVGYHYSTTQSRINLKKFTGYDGTIHSVGHNAQPGPGSYIQRKNVQNAAIARWYVSQFAYLVRRLKDTPDGHGGNLLDHSALSFRTEGGWGKDANDRNSTHSTRNCSALLAGRAGGLDAGKHIRATGAHPTQVITTAMYAVGAGHTLGEISGHLAAAF